MATLAGPCSRSSTTIRLRGDSHLRRHGTSPTVAGGWSSHGPPFHRWWDSRALRRRVLRRPWLLVPFEGTQSLWYRSGVKSRRRELLPNHRLNLPRQVPAFVICIKEVVRFCKLLSTRERDGVGKVSRAPPSALRLVSMNPPAAKHENNLVEKR